MKIEMLSIALGALLLNASDSCHKDNGTGSGCYKGKLAIAGICSNYTIQVLEGKIDTALVTKSWTDSTTGKTYTNVFGLESPCTFPADLKEGDEFYFTVGPYVPGDCMVCLAFYPTPPKKLTITVRKDCK